MNLLRTLGHLFYRLSALSGKRRFSAQSKQALKEVMIHRKTQYSRNNFLKIMSEEPHTSEPVKESY